MSSEAGLQQQTQQQTPIQSGNHNSRDLRGMLSPQGQRSNESAEGQGLNLQCPSLKNKNRYALAMRNNIDRVPSAVAEHAGGDNLWLHRGIHALRPGDVLVVGRNDAPLRHRC